MEKEPYHLQDMVISGSVERLKEVLQSRDVFFLIDVDGIIVNSPKKILGNFENRTGVKIHPSEIDRWDYLTRIAKEYELHKEVIETADAEWYCPEPLLASQPYLYVKPLLKKLIDEFGVENNYILTSRNPDLKDCTVAWFNKHFPDLQNNILIRENKLLDGGDFKVQEISKRAREHNWVVFIDDAISFTKQVVEANLPNVFVINVPLGV